LDGRIESLPVERAKVNALPVETGLTASLREIGRPSVGWAAFQAAKISTAEAGQALQWPTLDLRSLIFDL